MERRGSIVPALALILIGGYFLLINLNVIPSLGINKMWPGIVVLVGLIFWLGFIFGKDHDPGLTFVGTIAILVGLFFFLFTLNVNLFGLGHVTWGAMGQLWPAFPLIVGLAFVVLWIAGRFRDGGVLVPAVVLLVVGIGGFAYTLGDVPFFQDVLRWWPLLLIGLGLLVLLRAIVRPRAK